MKKFLVALFPLLLVDVAAQHAMHVEVQTDRIAIGSEFVPRFLDLSQTFVVVPGASTTLNAGTYGYIEVGGTLTIPAVEVRATHVVVLPGGTLIVECGATIVGRNVPIDTARDPFQWGNGLLNFGTLWMRCPEKTPFVPLEGDAASGAASLTLASEPIGWVVGDELVLPDTRQMTGGTPTRETGTTIAAISGRTVTLSKPLAFTRAAITRPDGSVVLRPRVANLGRRTVIRSEDPAGVRWHVAHVGLDASWDVQGVALVGLGRTRNERLDRTTADRSHIGTNQVGRYAFHMHHTGSSLNVRRISSSAIAGLNGGKWGVVVHQSHDIEILNNVCVDVPGSCFSTEDGNEVRNVFRGNFAAYVKGNGTEARQNVINDNDCRGCESAFWFGGVGNVIENNEAWNSQNGIDLFNIFPLAAGVAIPSVKGGFPDTTPALADMVPLSYKDNVVVANTDGGSVYWQLLKFPNERVIAAHNAHFQVKNGAPNGPSEIYLVDGSLICTGGVGGGLGSSSGYNTGVEMLRGEIRGCGGGLLGGGGKSYARFTETVFQNAININFNQPQSWAAEVRFTRVRHEPLPGHAPVYFYFEREAGWAGPSAPLPNPFGWGSMHGSRILIEDWQGTGKNYRLVAEAQERSLPAWATTDFQNLWTLPPPECGATMGEVWDRCGLAFGGEAYAASEAVALEGVVNQLAVPDPRPPLGTPHAVLTAPNLNGPAYVGGFGERIALYLALTGRLEAADRTAYISIDGGPTVAAAGGSGNPNWIRHWTEVIGEGTHTVRAWRQLNGAEVPNSAMTFRYVVGPYVPPPPPPPPPPPSDPPPPPPPPPSDPPPPPPPTNPCPTVTSCRR